MQNKIDAEQNNKTSKLQKRREFQRNSVNKYSFIGAKLVPNMEKVYSRNVTC